VLRPSVCLTARPAALRAHLAAPPHPPPPPLLPGWPSSYASRAATLYLLAEDDLPTYRGWTSACQPPVYNTSGPPGPCDPVTVVACNNTAPAVELNNRQAPPYAAWDAATAGANASLPAPPVLPTLRPLRSAVVLADPTPMAFTAASLASVGSGGARALIFAFSVTRPSLVRYQLVRNVVEVLAWGVFPVFDASQAHSVAISRDCAGAQLVPGTAYGLWHNASDIYGAFSPLRMLSQVLA
jgi:hypothetical protein